MEKDKKKSSKKPKFVWANLSNTHYMSVRQCIEEMGYQITDSEYKNMILWCDAGGSIETASTLQPWQFYNHFPGIWSIARKVELARNYERMYRIIPKIMDFHPKSFLLPGQFSDLKTYMLSIPKKADRTFIIKPDRGSQGRGIILVQDPDDLDEYCDMSVAQQYIDPYLIDGYKFDLRIYALLTSVDPLRIYIYQEGMARFCTEQYVPPKSSNLEQVYSHLTNYSLNKKNDHFQQPENAEEADCGSKRSLTSVYKYITKNGGDVSIIQHEIESIIRKTIGLIQPLLSNSYHTAINSKDEKSRCFEILGFDILLDSNLKPWLLEVNCMPSLACDSPFDTQLKFGVIKGTLKILDLNPNFKKRVLARQKAITQVRISGSTKIKVPELFDPKIETEISKTTMWKQIYPLEADNDLSNTKSESDTKTSNRKSKKTENNEEEDSENIDSEKLNSDGYVMELLLEKARQYPVCAAIETTASRARKEAVLQQIKQFEQNQNQNCPQNATNKTAAAANRKRTSNGTRNGSRTETSKDSKKKLKPLPRVAGLSTKPRQTTRNDSRISNSNSNSSQEAAKIVNEFSDLPMNNIDECEERERIKNIRKQAFLASSTNLLQNIKSLLQEQLLISTQQQLKLQEQKKIQQKQKMQQQMQIQVQQQGQTVETQSPKYSPGSAAFKYAQNPFNNQQPQNAGMPQIQIHQIQIASNQQQIQQSRPRNQFPYYNAYSPQQIQRKRVLYPAQQQALK
ncbi:positive regulation of cilium movement [Tritrichomonas musculus]|uniref:Positive regulation of cilium movement n=1 Tax=Tritrichomonas musculus TaxID=1915356 RepID=A0ABR2JUR4_9EUKA